MLRKFFTVLAHSSTATRCRPNRLQNIERLEHRIALHGDAVHGRFDVVPDFGAEPTIYSVASGNWSDPQVWSAGRIPARDDVVAISAENVVVYDKEKSPALDTVAVLDGGHLTFRDGVATHLLTANLMVMPEGTLTIGTELDPIDADATTTITIRDKPLDFEHDPAQWGTGVVAWGTIDVYGAAKTPFVRLAMDGRAGDAEVLLEHAPDGWRVGDELVIPETRQFEYGPGGTNQQLRTEKVRIQSIDGNRVTLTNPLAYDHFGARNAAGESVALPHAANIMRNVTIQSQNPTGTRGHTVFLDRADVDVHHAAFSNLGRTKNDPLDSTTFDPHGEVTHIGTNQIGRYPVHIHHLIGPESRVETDEYQFSFVGNAVTDSLKWPMAIHDAHYGQIKDNVVWGGFGFGIGTEDGSESHNVFEGNFVSSIRGTTGRGKDREGREGDGFWFAGPNNSVRNNVVADVLKAGYNIYGGANASAFPQVIPAFRGADKLQPGQGITVPMASVAVPEFDNNEVYSALMGIETWYLGYDNYYHPYQGMPETVIGDFLAWHTHRFVFFGNQQNHLTLDRMRAFGDPAFVHIHARSVGIMLLQSKAVTVRDAEIENYRMGVDFSGYLDELGSDRPVNEITPFLIEGGKLANYDNIVVGSPIVDQSTIPPRVVVIRDVDFRRLTGTTLEGHRDASPPHDVVMAIRLNTGNLIQDSVTYIYGYGPEGNQNYQLFLKEQSANFTVPHSAGPVIGAPIAGLTNAETWSRYGIAIAGQVAPASAFTLPDIFGLVSSLDVTIPGDLNGDATVNLLDLAIIQSNFGRTNGAVLSDGDLNGDGAVSLVDLRQFAANYGRSNATATHALIAQIEANELGEMPVTGSGPRKRLRDTAVDKLLDRPGRRLSRADLSVDGIEAILSDLLTT
jgi:hypothetical protein